MGLGESGVMEDSAKALYDSYPDGEKSDFFPRLCLPEVYRPLYPPCARLMGRADAIEGVMACLERGTPEWKLSVNDDWPEWPRQYN